MEPSRERALLARGEGWKNGGRCRRGRGLNRWDRRWSTVEEVQHSGRERVAKFQQSALCFECPSSSLDFHLIKVVLTDVWTMTKLFNNFSNPPTTKQHAWYVLTFGVPPKRFPARPAPQNVHI